MASRDEDDSAFLTNASYALSLLEAARHLIDECQSDVDVDGSERDMAYMAEVRKNVSVAIDKLKAGLAL